MQIEDIVGVTTLLGICFLACLLGKGYKFIFNYIQERFWWIAIFLMGIITCSFVGVATQVVIYTLVDLNILH